MRKGRTIANFVIFVMLAVLTGVSVGGTKTIKVQADARVVYAGNTDNNNVCFMINVYQGEDYVRDMLDLFDVYGTKTTFFVGGSWVVKNIDLVKEIYSRGHELGNHGFLHKDHDKLDYDQNEEEILLCHKTVLENIGVEMTLFAPPSGAYHTITVDVASSLNYKTIMWTRDTIDWRDQNVDLIYNRAIKNLGNGDLVLMHPTECSVRALSKILPYAINNGYNPTTVSGCL